MLALEVIRSHTVTDVFVNEFLLSLIQTVVAVLRVLAEHEIVIVACVHNPGWCFAIHWFIDWFVFYHCHHGLIFNHGRLVLNDVIIGRCHQLFICGNLIIAEALTNPSCALLYEILMVVLVSTHEV